MPSVNSQARSSPSAGQTLREPSVTPNDQVEVKHERPSPPPIGQGKPEVETAHEETDRADRQPMDTERKGVVPREVERVRVELQLKNKYSHASESAPTSQSRRDVEHRAHPYPTSASRMPRSSPHDKAVESLPGPRKDVEDLPNPSPANRGSKPSEAVHTISEETSSSQSAELGKRYETLTREHEILQSELQTKLRRLEERESQIKFLKADIADLQRLYENQSSALASTRSDLRSCRSQLDNVQRFVSTADAHADKDIILTLQGLNEEVYQMSMMMTDFVVDGFTRKRKEHVLIAENVFSTVGQVLLNHLAEANSEDIALFLQLAFQSYLSRVVSHVISSWTVDARLSSLIDDIYQRLRKTEAQSVSGRWRSLTRSHIQPTNASEPKATADYAVAGLSEIVKAAGFISPSQCDTASKLALQYGDKISHIVSHAWRFGNMASEMISGDFEAFVAQPGETFDGRSMMDMNEDRIAPRGKGAAQTVLCGSRVGLRKHMSDKTIIFTKAQVALRSFLG